MDGIAERQRERDIERLINPKISISQKKQIRATASLTTYGAGIAVSEPRGYPAYARDVLRGPRQRTL